jgi:serine/threonine-protein kinase
MDGLAWAAATGYNIISKLGEGAFGTTYLAQKDGSLYTLKVPLLTVNTTSPSIILENEAQILSSFEPYCNQYHISCYIERYPKVGSNVYLLSSRYAEGITLETKRIASRKFDHVPLSLQQVSQIMIDLLTALTILRVNRVAHRDIKCPNIIFSDLAGATLIDFGVASTGDSDNITGNLIAIAPKVIDEFISNDIIKLDTLIEGDLHALGVTLYQLVNRVNPYTLKLSPQFRVPVKLPDYSTYIHSNCVIDGITVHGKTKDDINKMIDKIIVEYDITTPSDLLTQWLN